MHSWHSQPASQQAWLRTKTVQRRRPLPSITMERCQYNQLTCTFASPDPTSSIDFEAPNTPVVVGEDEEALAPNPPNIGEAVLGAADFSLLPS